MSWRHKSRLMWLARLLATAKAGCGTFRTDLSRTTPLFAPPLWPSPAQQQVDCIRRIGDGARIPATGLPKTTTTRRISGIQRIHFLACQDLGQGGGDAAEGDHGQTLEMVSWEEGSSISFLFSPDRGDDVSSSPGGTPSAGNRLPALLHRRNRWLFPSASSARWAVRRQEVSVGGEIGTCETELVGGEEITIYQRGQSPFRKRPAIQLQVGQALEVLYEDEHIAAVVKPMGMPMYYSSSNEGRKQRASGPPDLLSSLPLALQPCTLDSALPGGAAASHRLDKGTGGIVLCCKTREAARSISLQFSSRGVEKRYRAVVIGHVTEGGTMIGDVDGKEALSDYEPVRATRSLKFDWLTLVDLRPKTGRKHQLRVHLASNGTPIAGDATYGVWMRRPLSGGHWTTMSEGAGHGDDAEVERGKEPAPTAEEGWEVQHSSRLQRRGMMLWAAGLEFEHPVDGRRMVLSAPESKKFEKLMEKEEARWQRLGEGWGKEGGV